MTPNKYITQQELLGVVRDMVKNLPRETQVQLFNFLFAVDDIDTIYDFIKALKLILKSEFDEDSRIFLEYSPKPTFWQRLFK